MCLQCGEGTLSIKFTGLLNDKMRGFYRSGYKVGEETRYAAVTQFEVSALCYFFLYYILVVIYLC